MTRIILVLILIGCLSCNKNIKSNEGNMRVNHWNQFDKINHLKPTLSKVEFDTLSGWDFGWFLLEPINIIKDQDDHEIAVTKIFSPGQKALHFFWYLDGQVTNGGFIQFYLNGYGKYIPAILDGLNEIGDSKMVELVKRADNLYIKSRSQFEQQSEKIEEEGWGNLYEELEGFEDLDDEYYATHDNSMALLEKYARSKPNEFGTLK